MCSLKLDNIEAFDYYIWNKVADHLLTYKGLQRLELELVNFDITASCNLEPLITVILHHEETLTKISLSKNKLKNDFFKTLADRCAIVCKLEYLEIRHLKEARNLDFAQALTEIAKFSEHKDKPILTVGLSGYQTYA